MPDVLISAAAMGLNPIPDSVWHCCTDPKAVDDMHLINCINANKDGGKDATYGNADLCGSPQTISTDPAPVTCTYDPLPPQK